MFPTIDNVKKYTNKDQLKLISKALEASQEEKRLRKEHEEKQQIEQFEREREEKLRIKQERDLEQLKLKELEESFFDVKQVQEKKPLTFKEEFLTNPIEPSIKKNTWLKQRSLDINVLYEAYRASTANTLEEKIISFRKIKELIVAGANINILNNNFPFGSLHLAALFQSTELIGFLILNGADPNQTTPGNDSLCLEFLNNSKAPWHKHQPVGLVITDLRLMAHGLLFRGKITPCQLYDSFSKLFYSLLSTPSFTYQQIVECALEKKQEYQEKQHLMHSFLTANLIHNEGNPLAEVNRESLTQIFEFLNKKIDRSKIQKAEELSVIQLAKKSKSARLHFFDRTIATTTKIGEEEIATIKTDEDFSEVISQSISKNYFEPSV